MFFLESLEQYYGTDVNREEREDMVALFGAGIGAGVFADELVRHAAFGSLCERLGIECSSRALVAHLRGLN